MTYSYVNDHIAYALIIAIMLSTLLIRDAFKRHQIAVRRVPFHFQKISFLINMISLSFSLTIKEYSDKRY